MILVTGGAGFIGSNLLAALEETHCKPVVICDRLGSTEKWKNICTRNPVTLIHPDALPDFLEDKGHQLDLVFHLGAISTTTERNVERIVQYNFKFSWFLFTWCAEKGKRFIYASSAATYGDGSQGFEDLDTPEYLASLRPLNAYAWSKHWFDRRVVTHIQEGGSIPPQWAGLKFFNVYGPNESHKGPQQSVAAHIFREVYQDKKPARLFKSYNPEFPHGGQKRDFIWVKDCVSLLLWLMDNPSVNGIFNVGTGHGRSFMDLALSVYSALGHTPDITFIPMPEGLEKSYQYFTQASLTHLRKAGYTKAFTPLEEGVRQYVQDFLIHPVHRFL